MILATGLQPLPQAISKSLPLTPSLSQSTLDPVGILFHTEFRFWPHYLSIKKSIYSELSF